MRGRGRARKLSNHTLHPIGATPNSLPAVYAMQIADVGHSTALFRNHVEWSQRLQEEFFTQGDKEKELNLEISPLMNREKPGVMHPSNQMYFLDVIVIPMLELWTQIGPNAGGSLMAQALHNREQWEQRKTAAVEEP